MSNFLSNLIARTTELAPVVKPRPLMMFEQAPVAPQIPFFDQAIPTPEEPETATKLLEKNNKSSPDHSVSKESLTPITAEPLPEIDSKVEHFVIEESRANAASKHDQIQIEPDTLSPEKSSIIMPSNALGSERSESQASTGSQPERNSQPALSEGAFHSETTGKTAELSQPEIMPQDLSNTPEPVSPPILAATKPNIDQQTIRLPVVEERYIERLVHQQTAVPTLETPPQPIVSPSQNIGKPKAAKETAAVRQEISPDVVPQQLTEPEAIHSPPETMPSQIEQIVERPLPTIPKSMAPVESNEKSMPESVNRPLGKPVHGVTVVNQPVPVIMSNTPEHQKNDERPEPAIHVHIGRIEVRAVPPPAEPKPVKQTTPPVMSLDDYLAQRNGGGKKG